MNLPTQQYFPPGPTADGWPAHAVLIYSGFYELGRSGLARVGGMEQKGVRRNDDGDWLAEDFIPYVARVDEQGTPTDWLFDTFIFLGLSSNRRRFYDGEREQDVSCLWADWQWYTRRLYEPHKQLDALNTAVGHVGHTLGDPNRVVNVYLMIPYPSYKVTDFGHLDGSMGGDSLLPVENRLRAITWYIDQVLNLWDANKYPHLRLAGFYWLQEHINPKVPDEEQLVRTIVSLVQQKDYKIGWIPWSGAYLADNWAEYGFDWAIMQPNHMFQDKKDGKTPFIDRAVERARNHRMGIEIELDGRAKEEPGEEKLFDYLNAGVDNGYMSEAMIGYYQDVFMLGQMCQHPKYRHMYDAICEFVKGTYKKR